MGERDKERFGLGLRCLREATDVEDRLPRLRIGRGAVWGSGRSPKLATRPLTDRSWFCAGKFGKVGRVLATGAF